MTPHLFFSYFLYSHNIPGDYWYIDLVRMVVLVLMGLFGLLLAVPPLVWWERRLLGFMQQRQGPNRVGPAGILQTIADGVKLLFKEDMNPRDVDKLLFVLAPMVFLIPSLTTATVIPWGASRTWGAAAPNVNIGVLYMLAWSSLGVYGIVMAGWSSNNKYSLLGGLRSSAQMVSYELGMGLAVLSVVLLSSSLGLQNIVENQGYYELSPDLTKYGIALPLWNVFKFFPMGFNATLIYIISMFAETNRAPFDLPEAETELVAGYHTEYTSMKFATFFMGEYANMIVVSAIASTLFFGGFLAPIPLLNGPAYVMRSVDPNVYIAPWSLYAVMDALIPWAWLMLKVLGGLYLFIWIRATLPRLRYDMLMKFGWQGLLPIALINLLLIAVGMSVGYVAALVSWAVIFAVTLFFFAKSKPSLLFTTNTRRNTTIQLHSTAQPFRGTPEHPGRYGQTLPPDAPIGGFPVAKSIEEREEIDAALAKKG